jgi:hypothetical protein
MPTFPAPFIERRVTLLVLMFSFLLSVVPRKLFAGFVPAFPVKLQDWPLTRVRLRKKMAMSNFKKSNGFHSKGVLK